ncbi:MAG: glycosyltransferase [Longimicrobiales bacterium]
MSRPDLSAVVVTWNIAGMAETTVRRVLERCGALAVEVLVVDNASADGTAERLRTAFAPDFRVQVLDAGANLGFPRANNLALERARGRHVLFLNPDTEVGEGTLEACVAELDGDPAVGVVGCRLEYADGRIQFEGARRDYRLRHLVWEAFYLHAAFPRSALFAHQLMGEFDHRSVRDVEAVSGAFLLTRRSLALELGGLPDELFMYHEDLSYCLRARRAGYRVRYRGDTATLHHGAAASSRNPAPLELLEGEMRVRLVGERGGRLAAAMARPVFAVRQLVRLLVSLPVAAVPALRRRWPQVADVEKQLRLLAWTVWPRAVWGRLERAGVPRDERPGLLVIGPTPPPVHGVSAYVRMLTTYLPLRARFRVVGVDTSDRRSIENIGRWDPVNVALGVGHMAALARALLVHRPAVTYVPVSQNAPAFLRDTLFVALARAVGSRVVLHLHGGAFGAFYASAWGPMRALIRWTHRRVHRVWVLGEGLRMLYDGLVPAENLRVVPNGVADPRDPSDAPSASPRMFIILFLGQLSGAKGVDVLLDAADVMAGRGVPFRLVVAGGWGTAEDRRRLEPRMQAMAARGLLEASGIVAGGAKARLLAGADAFVLASTAPEGQPLAILEAMAMGLPVVATPQGAVPDMVVDGETGRLVPVGDARALADALAALAAAPALRARMGRAARARYEARFTADAALGRATEELLDALA